MHQPYLHVTMMPRRTHLTSSRWPAFPLALALLLSSTPTLAQTLAPSQQTEWDHQREEGKSASQAGQWQKARDAYHAAWQLKQDWKLAANLGRAEFQVGRYRDAAEHLAYCIREAPPGLSREAPAEWNALRDLLQKARGKVEALAITVEPAGAEVVVGGVVVGRAPLRDPVFVEPGMVTIEARMAGYATGRVSLTAGAGKEEAVKLVLAAPVSVPVKVVEQPAGVERPRVSGKQLAGFVAAGVGVVGLGIGGVTGIMALGKYGETWNGCSRSAAHCPQENTDAARAGTALTAASTTAFALGLVGAGVGTYLLWTTWPRRGSVGLTTLPGGGGLTVTSAF